MENIQDIYPLTPMQEGMLFHSIYSEDSEVYQEQFSCKLSGNINVELFKKSWEIIIDRHDILRTAFIWEDVDEPLQVVQEKVDLPFEYIDYSDKDKNTLKIELEKLRQKLHSSRLEFTNAPLMRIKLVKLSSTEHYLIWDHHHILFDGWGLPLLMNEIVHVYTCLQTNSNINLPRVSPYKNYIAWIREQDEERTQEFWKDRLKGLENATNIILPTINGKKNGYSRKSFQLPAELTDKINEFISIQKITLNTFLQSAWAILLGYYTRQNDIVFGATFSGRNAPIPDIENIIGLFINTLPIRVNIDRNIVINDWLKNFQLQQSELQQYEYSPLFKIQKWVDGNFNGSLFNNIFVFENYPKSEALEKSDSELKISEVISIDSTNYPLTIVVSPSSKIIIEYAFDSHLFDELSVDRINRRFEKIINELISKSHLKLGEINYLDDSEKEKLLEISSGKEKALEYTDICSWFGRIVEENKDKNALVGGEEKYSFKQLHEKVGIVANNLKNSGVQHGDRIALIADRSIEMVITLFGILKIGASVVPIDENYPLERIEYILDDSNSKMVIKSKTNNLKLENRNIFNIESLLEPSQNKYKETFVYSSDEAYLIYTSGSTGKPKGVSIEHKGICNFVNYTIDDFELSSEENILQFASFGFDAAMGEIFSAILSGNTLYIPTREETLDKNLLTTYINKNNITFAYFTPSYLSVMEPDELKTKLKIASVGDKCTPNIANKWGEKFIMFNGYGPTETSIGATFHKYSKSNIYGGTIPIGKAFKNVKVYILDENLSPVDIGVPGEIFIGGNGVGRGYNNDPVKTASSFIPNPFSSDGSRMYRTGDLGKCLPNGEIEFLGRVDNQIKIRGFRIELSEIERRLNNIEGIENSVVKAFKGSKGNEYLVAYIIKNDDELKETFITNLLSKELPSYMIPKSIVFMESFPLTINKKIDIAKLPNPENKSFNEDYVEPSTPTEEILANIWADVLNIEKVGRSDNFFELGGHSLLATQLISRIRETFKKEIPFSLVFESADLMSTAEAIDNYSINNTSLPRISKNSDKNKIPLSYSQHRLWFLDKLKPGDISYNIPTAIRIKGKVDLGLIDKSINAIINKHESLRTTFVEESGKPYLKIHDELKLKVNVENLIGNDEKEKIEDAKSKIVEEIKNPFVLSELPLIRIKIYKISENDIIFFLVAHHIICDGWSLTILVDEFIRNYNSLQNSEENNDKLEIQFSDYTIWLSEFSTSDEYKKQLEYWKNELIDAPPVLELPLDKPRPKVQSNKSSKIEIYLDDDTKRRLVDISRNDNATLFMILLSAFEILLSKYSNQNDIVVGTPIAGREFKEVEPLIGFFVNNLAIRGKIDVKESFREFLTQIRDKTINAYSNQTIPFDKIVEEIQPVRDLSHQPIFQVMFVFQNLIKTKNVIDNIEIEELKIWNETTNYDITLTLGENRDGIGGVFEYNSDLFYESSINRMIQHYKLILKQIIFDPEIAIEDITIISSDEKNFILNSVNNDIDSNVYPENVLHKFDDTCKQYADNIAVFYDDNNQVKKLSYSELDRYTNCLAKIINSYGISFEDRVAIYLERDINIIVTMIGILKAGAVFVPIDPSLPEERVKYILDDSGCSIVIVDNKTKPLADGFNRDILQIDDIDFNQNYEQEDLSNNLERVLPENLAYIIYTSGSTGMPKGVMLSHKGLINLAQVQKEEFRITEQSNVMQFSSISFDASVWETVMALLNGATLCMTSKEVISSGYELSNFIKRNNISNITLPPSVLAVLPKANYNSLETLITAGEAVSNDLVNKWRNGRAFFNAYGPTETTVCASMMKVNEDYPKGPPIGKPIRNFNLFVINSDYNLVGIGIPGELCVSGVGLARGYVNKPDLTADKFIPNYYSTIPGDRLYRTGDLVRILEDGNIEFLGRIDTQVKIRGFRIEIGEIENALKSLNSIKDSTVVAKTNGELKDKIIAYVVCNESEFNKSQILEQLKKKLPDYMIPNFVVRLENLPLNTSGKIDKAKLPLPQFSREDLSADYIPPRNEKEEKLVNIVSQLLKIDKVGIKDNFFELGGHSLLATQFISRIRDEFGVEVKLITIFEDPTIEGVLNSIEKESQAPKIERPKITRVSRESRKKRNSDLQ